MVTAAHDGLALEPGVSLSATSDLRLRGAVISVGRSSMEVQTDLLRVVREAGMAEREEFIGSCYTGASPAQASQADC